ncbi:hypothetical protein [Salmonella phage phC11]|uniref:Uncharacterized protein n=1 Tax=Salmonella phage phA11 TaxID=3038307 RepID=A0AAF0GCX7_9CAUD|nr:hypothetical protein [Salmonella phage phA11]WGG14569.1 hypothetical protein [Salmonella phage phC11]
MLHYIIAINRQITSQTRVTVRKVDADYLYPEETTGEVIVVALVTNGVEEIIYESPVFEVDYIDDAVELIDELINQLIELKPNRKIFKESFINELRYIQNTASDCLSFEFFTLHYQDTEDFYTEDKAQEV